MTEDQSDDELLDFVTRRAWRVTPPPEPGALLPFVPWDTTERRLQALQQLADANQACRDAAEAELRRKDEEKAAEHAEALRRRHSQNSPVVDPCDGVFDDGSNVDVEHPLATDQRLANLLADPDSFQVRTRYVALDSQ